jgi:hypothetical protein
MNPAVRLGSCNNIEIRTVPHSGRLNRGPGYPDARIAEAIFQATKADTHKVVMPESDSAIQALVDSRFQPGCAVHGIHDGDGPGERLSSSTLAEHRDVARMGSAVADIIVSVNQRAPCGSAEGCGLHTSE